MTGTAGEHSGRRILIVGTGGQGVILCARLLTSYFVQRGHQVVSDQAHGMAQRGGVVQSTVILNRGSGPLIPLRRADVVLGLEPLEAVRALPFVSVRTRVFLNTTPVVPFVVSQEYVLGRKDVRYPSLTTLLARIRSATPSLYTLDATAEAKRAGSVKTLNIVMLGCLIGSGILPCTPEDFMNTVMKTVPPRLAETNNKAFLAGVAFGFAVRDEKRRSQGVR